MDQNLNNQELYKKFAESLNKAEQNYQSAINTCRITEAKQFKIQIEYYKNKLIELDKI